MDVFQNMELFSELIQCGGNIYTWCYNADGSLLQSNCPEAGFLSGAFDLFGCKKKMLDYGSRHTKPVTLGTAIGMTWAAAFEKDGSALKRAWVIGPVFYQDVSLRGIEQGLQYYNRLETSVAWSMQLYEALKTVPVLQCTVLHRYALMMHYCLTGNHLAISDINSEDLTQVRNAVQQPAHDRHKVWMAEQGLLQMVRTGDLNYKQALSASMGISAGVPVRSDDALRQSKTSIIVFTSLVCRAAIEGGLSPEEAYALGDSYIQSAENGKTTIQSGVAQFEIQSMNPTDFPELPNTGAEETLNIKTGVLRDMIERTLYAVSQDEKKPAHTGELFEISPDKLTVVALDGYRLAIVERPVEAIKEIRIIVPSKTMNEVSHLLANDDEETVHISANRRYVVFTTAGYTIMSRLIEGEFLNYHNVIPNGSRTSVVLDTKEFIETIERASLIITERLKNPLRISFTEGKVVVRCQTNLGRVVDEFNAQCEGDEVEIGFNNRYLLDALRNARTEQVKLEISGPLSPVKVLPTEGSDFLYLVLPVRFKND